jgi:hypothetical protein
VGSGRKENDAFMDNSVPEMIKNSKTEVKMTKYLE